LGIRLGERNDGVVGNHWKPGGTRRWPVDGVVRRMAPSCRNTVRYRIRIENSQSVRPGDSFSDASIVRASLAPKSVEFLPTSTRKRYKRIRDGNVSKSFDGSRSPLTVVRDSTKRYSSNQNRTGRSTRTESHTGPKRAARVVRRLVDYRYRTGVRCCRSSGPS